MNIDKMVDRFLAWPLPQSVCSDRCVCEPNYRYPRSGTSLLTAEEAKQMLLHVIADEADEVTASRWWNNLGPREQRHWGGVAESCIPAIAYAAFKASVALAT